MSTNPVNLPTLHAFLPVPTNPSQYANRRHEPSPTRNPPASPASAPIRPPRPRVDSWLPQLFGRITRFFDIQFLQLALPQSTRTGRHADYERADIIEVLVATIDGSSRAVETDDGMYARAVFLSFCLAKLFGSMAPHITMMFQERLSLLTNTSATCHQAGVPISAALGRLDATEGEVEASYPPRYLAHGTSNQPTNRPAACKIGGQTSISTPTSSVKP